MICPRCDQALSQEFSAPYCPSCDEEIDWDLEDEPGCLFERINDEEEEDE